MASFPMIPICFILLSLSLTSSSSSSNSSSGLRLEFTLPLYPKSSLFVPNLTFEERIKMLVQQSDTRVQHLSNKLLSTLDGNNSQNSLQQHTMPMPMIKKALASSMVLEVGIGTFDNDSYKSYLLIMDTGSSNIWTQCEDCRVKPYGHCYPQNVDYFPNSKSKSYKPLNPPSPYNSKYGDGSSSSGIFAKETFTFPSSSSPSQHLKLPNIIFGCGTNNHHPLSKGQNFPITGIFGLGMGERSFINQIKTQSDGKFSYCLTRMDMQNPPPLYLRFGNNIKPPRSSKTIKFLKTSTSNYFVNLVDLGVNKEKLHLHEGIINSRNIRTKGILVDSGSAVSYLNKEAYDIVVKKLDNHFSKHKGEFKKDKFEDWVVYSRIKGEGYNNIPGITFYFEGGAQMDINPESTFIRIKQQGGKETFALTIRETPIGLNILGAFQQVNYKLIYNIKDKTLKFGQEDCAKNG